jgi:ribosomal-protein-alanine N-acetyltransferase
MLLQYETNRLLLKVLGPDYAEQVLDFYLEDQELFERYEADRSPNFYTKEHHAHLLEVEYRLILKMQLVRFYVFLKEDPEHIIGTVSLYDLALPYSRGEVGYKFSSRYHHRGYASEAMEKLIDIAFTELHVHRLCARVLEQNTPSIRLLEALGFKKEGICRDYMCLKGQWLDHLQYSLIVPELNI